MIEGTTYPGINEPFPFNGKIHNVFGESIAGEFLAYVEIVVDGHAGVEVFHVEGFIVRWDGACFAA